MVSAQLLTCSKCIRKVVGDFERVGAELVFSELSGSVRIREETNSSTSFSSFILSLLLLAVWL